MGIFPYIGLIYGRYLQFRFLKWPLTCVYHAFRGFPVDFRGSHRMSTCRVAARSLDGRSSVQTAARCAPGRDVSPIWIYSTK